MYVQPAAGDGGGALEPRCGLYNTLLGKPRNFQMDHAFWGRGKFGFGNREFLTQNNIPHTRYDNEDKLLDAVVEPSDQRQSNWMGSGTL